MLEGDPSGKAVAFPLTAPSRAGLLPWLKTMMASAPAASALTALTEKGVWQHFENHYLVSMLNQ